MPNHDDWAAEVAARGDAVIPIGKGIHRGVPMETYLDNCCPGPSVSGSTLFTLHESCPAKALAGHYLSPWPRDEGDTAATAFGTALHTLILEPDAFQERYAVKPEDMTFASREGKAWRAENEGRGIIRQADFDLMCAMRDAAERHPAARNAFEGGAAEVTAVTQDAETGLWLKVRPDYLRPGLAINLKSTADAAEQPWTRDAVKYGYHVSAALAVDVLRDLGEKAHYAFVVIEKEPPHLVSVRVLDDAFMLAGRMIYRRALQAFAECLAKFEPKDWPGYGDDVTTVNIPPWLDRQLNGFSAPL